ncbi:MAG: hypothetical protein M3Y64_02110 [Gemmatimonadota bacterium]|nr:hypothetical protein [Gemmatimonadota bacterium]
MPVIRMLAQCMLLAVVGACATGTATQHADMPQTVRGGDPSLGNLRVAPSSGTDVVQLPYSVEKIWAALPAAFDSISVPVATIDQATHRFGNEGFKLRQRLGKTTLSRLFDCGETQIGPNADSYEVFLIVLAQVTPVAAASASLTTTIDASAKSIANAQGYIKCSSKGVLETRLLAGIKAGLEK